MDKATEKVTKLFRLSETPFKEEGKTSLEIARKIMEKNNFAEKEDKHPLIAEYFARYCTIRMQDSLYEIDDAQPENERLGHDKIDSLLNSEKGLKALESIDFSDVIRRTLARIQE